MISSRPASDEPPAVPDPLRVAVLFEGGWVTGPARNLLRFAQRARRPERGLPRIEMLLITYSRGHIPGDRSLAGEARRAGLAVEIVPERHRFDWRVLPQIRRIVEAWRPHVVQTHQVKSHFLVRLSGLWKRHLWLAFHHGYTRVDLKMLLYNQLDRCSLRAADHLVTVCQAFVPELEQRGVRPERITVQHNCVEPPEPVPEEEIRALRERWQIGDGAAVLLSVGRLSKEKGHTDLLRSLAELRRSRRGLNFRLLVVGDGKEGHRLEELRRRLGLEREVIFAGHQDRVAPYYRVADVVVISSHSEGSPNVLLEAMAARVPVVATRVGGIPEIAAEGETALLVPPREPVAMAAAIERLLRSAEERKRLAEAAYRLVESRFTPEAYHASLRQFYKRFWEQRAGRLAAAATPGGS